MDSNSINKCSVLVIGGGPGGYVAAIRAAQLGADVILVEKDAVGGTCLNRGCMPTKALLHTSELYESAISNSDIGIKCENVTVDWAKVQEFRASVVEKLTSGVKSLIRMNKIKLVRGCAKFIKKKTVLIDETEYTADKIIIASGSSPVMPNIPGLIDSRATVDSTACLSLSSIPKRMVVIGGGVIGLELGCVYHRFGADVTIVELQDRLLPLMDGELTGILQEKLEKEGICILTSSAVTAVEDLENESVVTVKTKSDEIKLRTDKILVSVGRAPETDELDLEKAGIETQNGFIKVNKQLETSDKDVYAIGDCTGILMLAHAAMAMGEVASENALGGKRSFNPELSPSCAYIGPEFAGVGYTEERVKELGLAYKVGRFPTVGNGRSLVERQTDGMIKVIAGEKYGEILGVHILAPRATEIIEEASLAIRLEATIDELADTIHCHPTISEAFRECTLAVEKKAIHIPNR